MGSKGKHKDEEAPLLGAGPVAVARPMRDVGWLVAYLICLLAALAGGGVAFVQRNPDFAELITAKHLRDPKSCPLPQPGRLLLSEDLSTDPVKWDALLHAASIWIALSACGSIAVGVLFLFLVKAHPRALVFTAIALQCLVPTGAAGFSFYKGAMPVGVVFLIVACASVLCFYLWREQIGQVTALLGTAGKGLASNTSLIGVALLIQALLAVALLPLLLALVAGVMNGSVQYNSARASGDTAACVDEDGKDVACCVWEVRALC